MGNSNNAPNDGKLSLDTSAPLWSAIMSDVSKGMPIEGFRRVKPKGLVTRTVDAFTGTVPGPSTRKTVPELFLTGTGPRKPASMTVTLDIDAASGLRWQEGCAGPMVTKAFIDLSKAESGIKRWQKADLAWQARAARGPGRRRRPEAHPHGVLLRRRVLPLRPDVGRLVRPGRYVFACSAAHLHPR